ncbi:MAG: YicC/YloC family endoribonuclease [Saprospiraceae bacterium]
MVLSMTGFGRAEANHSTKEILVEIRSLNSKFTDIRLKIPQNYKEKEVQIRKLVSDKVERGKIEVSMEIRSPEGDEDFSLNVPLFKRYFKELSGLSDEFGITSEGLVPAILRLPNVVGADIGTLDTQEWNQAKEAILSAVKAFNKFRADEGKAMETDLRLRINNIQTYLGDIPPFEQERVVKLRTRLMKNLEENFSKEKVDQNRFEQEVIYYLEKMDITEEKVRLGQHCKYFLEQVDAKDAQKGRKLSFISQEIGREINTLGAKAYSSDIQRLVVKMKDDLEKIKEQVANAV